MSYMYIKYSNATNTNEQRHTMDTNFFTSIASAFPIEKVTLRKCENCGDTTTMGLCSFCYEVESAEMARDDKDMSQESFEIEICRLEKKYGKKYSR